MSAEKMLSEMLNDLSFVEFDEFKSLIKLERGFPASSRRQLKVANTEDIVELLVETYSQECVEVTKKVLKKMNRRYLVQRLSDTSSGAKEKHSLVEQKPSGTQKMATLAVKELLLETLSDLSHKELKNFKWFLRFTFFKRGLSTMPWERHMWVNSTEELVDVMVEMAGQQSVEVTKEVLKDMNRIDLLQRLSESSPGPKEKLSVDEHQPAPILKVETMASVTELLLETLADLSNEELHIFKEVLQSSVRLRRRYFDFPWWLMVTDMQEIVFLMMLNFGQESVEVTKEALKKISRTDLVQRLSGDCSAPKQKHSADDHQSALILRVATMSAVKELLLETLSDLSHKELNNFKWFLSFTLFKRGLSTMSWERHMRVNSTEELVDVMVEMAGQQSVEVTKEVLKDMNRIDLLQRLSESSPGPKEKHQSDLLQKEPMTSVKKKLLDTLENLSYGGLEQFKHVLLYSKVKKKGLPRIPMEMAHRAEIADLMVEIYGEQSVEVTIEVLKEMNRRDLVQRLSDTSSASKGPSRSLELEGCGSMMQDSNDWTKLGPEVNSTDATYSLQSEAGSFECCVSGLRWVCKEQVSFRYQYFSWGEHMERMESIEYMPAGPLIDIIVIAGKFDEVYLPHWIYIDDNPEITDKFAVLHIDDCGDVVEKAAEVTSAHAKLSEPLFSPRAVLMKIGFPVKIRCIVLIYYKPNTPFLKLHVYMIPLDPALKQTVHEKELSEGYKVIQSKPRPDKYLKMHQGFTLTANIDAAKILPKKITLRYDSQDPNFYEVYIENPERNFHLTLSQLCTNKGGTLCEPVWTCEIRKDDYRNSAHLEATESSTELYCGALVGAQESDGQSTKQGSIDKKYCEDELLSAGMKAVTITTDRERLLKTLKDLKPEELKEFKWFLQDCDIGTGLPCISAGQLEKSDVLDLVDLMLQTYGQQSVEVTKNIFKKINRNDLMQRL
ncbi:uncharacterized protein [Pempheris klunzingeri]|uniref:uncharacterized protein isoform X2 n=1 Tax=Pempheris klunzingeri TaxID=3127111 RepID=UPI0039800B9B